MLNCTKTCFAPFDYAKEDDIYDALANSVDGDLLRSLYLDINESLKVKEQGGAVSRVDEVKIVEGAQVDLPASPTADPDQPPSFGYRSKWDLVGTVEHWGHIHQRTTHYDAEFQIQLRDDAWKITDMKVVDFVPGQVKTSLRKF